jgi:hypothetical protein
LCHGKYLADIGDLKQIHQEDPLARYAKRGTPISTPKKLANAAAMDCPVQKTSKIKVSKYNIKHILHRVEKKSGFSKFMQILMQIFKQQHQ